MRTIFVGGPGRSGTSLVASCLADHPDIVAFQDIELKFITENSGLLDLYNSFFRHYSPNRASVALKQCRSLTDGLISGRLGQRALSDVASPSQWNELFDRFYAHLTTDGVATRPSRAEYIALVERLLSDIADLSAQSNQKKVEARFFLEKTPHSLLEAEFLHLLQPNCVFIHVMRDPRSIAHSLQGVPWGPGTLKACCHWVANYCEAWSRAQRRAALLGVSINQFSIEALAFDREYHSDWITEILGVEKIPTLFRRANRKSLNGWQASCEMADMRLLNDQLADWATYFGYSSSLIGTVMDGRRSSASFTKPSRSQPVAPAFEGAYASTFL